MKFMGMFVLAGSMVFAGLQSADETVYGGDVGCSGFDKSFICKTPNGVSCKQSDYEYTSSPSNQTVANGSNKACTNTDGATQFTNCEASTSVRPAMTYETKNGKLYMNKTLCVIP
jgi:hypothetical protein